MKTPRRQKFLAFFLAIALSLTLIPAQVLAIEIDQRKESLQIERAEAASAEPAQDAEIVSEIPSGRDAYQKEFLLSNGQRMLAVYPTAVHYQENGQWEEIDNTLRAERQNGSTVYRNTAGAWDVALPAQMDARQAVSVEQDGFCRFPAAHPRCGALCSRYGSRGGDQQPARFRDRGPAAGEG